MEVRVQGMGTGGCKRACRAAWRVGTWELVKARWRGAGAKVWGGTHGPLSDQLGQALSEENMETSLGCIFLGTVCSHLTSHI